MVWKNDTYRVTQHSGKVLLLGTSVWYSIAASTMRPLWEVRVITTVNLPHSGAGRGKVTVSAAVAAPRHLTKLHTFFSVDADCRQAFGIIS